jgi:hypothetical protein
VTFTVTVVPRANPRVKALRGKAKDKLWEAVNRLEHEGCAAGHYRMRAPDGSDAHVCGLRFYADWRMHIVFAEHNEIVVSWVGQHSDKENRTSTEPRTSRNWQTSGAPARTSRPAAMSPTRRRSTKNSSTGSTHYDRHGDRAASAVPALPPTIV